MKRRSFQNPETKLEVPNKQKMLKEKEEETTLGILHEKSQRDDQSIADKSNPLLNDVFLRKVMDLLPVPTLKICRQVCRQWNECGTPRMLKTGVIVLNAENVEDLAAIESWMNSIPYSQQQHSKNNSNSTNPCNDDYTLRSHFHSLRCDRITHLSYPNIWRLLGNHVKSLAISHWWGNQLDLTLQDYEDILLKQCPNLEHIVMPSTAMFKSASSFLLCATREDTNVRLNLRSLEVTGKFRPDMRFFRIFSIAPFLISLKFECALIAEFWNPVPDLSSSQNFFSALKNIKTWELRKYANDSLSALTNFYFLHSTWSLEAVVFEMYKLDEADILRSLEHIRKTLRSIRILFFNKQYDSWVASDRDKPWIISSALTKMERLQIYCDDLCEGPIFCKTLVYAILLPNLTSLTLTMYENGHQNNLVEWDEGLFLRIYKDILPILMKNPDQLKHSKVDSSESNVCHVLQRILDEQELEAEEDESNTEDELDSDEELSDEEVIYNELICHPFEDERGPTTTVKTSKLNVLLDEKANDPLLNTGQLLNNNCSDFKWIRRECLKQLTLPSKMCDISSIVPIITIFPNIRELKLDIPSHRFLQGILTHWTKLERLEVSLESKPEIDWNIILTGEQSSIANLHHLHNLKILMVPSRKTSDDDDIDTIFTKEKDPCNQRLHDLFIYEGLLKLDYLQSISITGQNFSERAVASLRDKCLPFCYIDFKN